MRNCTRHWQLVCQRDFVASFYWYLNLSSSVFPTAISRSSFPGASSVPRHCSQFSIEITFSHPNTMRHFHSFCDSRLCPPRTDSLNFTALRRRLDYINSFHFCFNSPDSCYVSTLLSFIPIKLGLLSLYVTIYLSKSSLTVCDMDLDRSIPSFAQVV